MGYCGHEGVGRGPAGCCSIVKRSAPQMGRRSCYYDANTCERDIAPCRWFPFRFDSSGRTAAADDENHIRDLISERCLRHRRAGQPANHFGSGLMRLVFAPSDAWLQPREWQCTAPCSSGWEMWCSSRPWMGHDEAALRVTVRYTVRRPKNAASQNWCG
jgi:hypothetical protein